MARTFVGRDRELSLLRDLGDRVLREGRPAAALFHGNPGSGKTRLLQEARAQISAGASFQLAGYEPERHVPLAAGRTLLHELTEFLEAPAASTRDRKEPGLGLLQIFETVARALSALQPVLVTLDDLQWADEASIALCHYLIRASETSGLAVSLIAATRSAPAASGFAATLSKLLGDRFHDVALGPLDANAGVLLAREIDPSLGADEARSLWEKAGGSPFWLEILVREGTADVDADALVMSRLSRVSADAATVLTLLSLAGRSLSRHDLPRILEWSDERTSAAERELTNLGLVVESLGSVLPAHDVIREAVVRHVPREHRREMSTRLADFLERRAGDDPQLLLEALEHRRAAGLALLDLALRVVDTSGRRVLGRMGVRRLAQAVDEAHAADAAAAAFQRKIASLASEIEDFELALERWGDLSGSSEDPLVRSRAALEASKAALELYRGDEARAYLSRCRAENPGDSVLTLEADACDASVMFFGENRTNEALALTRRTIGDARELAGRAGGTRNLEPNARRAFMLASLGASLAAWLEDDFEGMLEAAEDAVSAARGVDELAYLQARSDSGYALLVLGRAADGAIRLEEAWHRARRLAAPGIMMHTGDFLARWLIPMGRLEDAESLVAEMVDLRDRLGGAHSRPAYLIDLLLNQIRLSRGDWRSGIHGLRHEMDGDPNSHDRVRTYLVLSLALGRLAKSNASRDVVENIRNGLALAEATRCRKCRREVLIQGADALARVGASDQARDFLALWQGSGGAAHPLAEWWGLRANGSIAVADGPPASAAQALETVRIEGERRGLGLEVLWALLDLGDLLGDLDREEAVKVLQEAARRARKMGAITELRLAEQSLRSLGVRTWRRGRAARGQALLADLTEREREIARLVADGATNPQIAVSLFLSRKTVERHVSNIFRKLDLRNRAELAARVGRPAGAATPSSEDEGVAR